CVMTPTKVLLALSLFIIHGCVAWDQQELGMYDLIEEVNQNFYELFGIEPTATTQEVKKAYRKMSLEWHPDRNSADNAAEKFRQVVGVYEVLKDFSMREKYDSVLENGMPDWRSGIYYYRRYRKMGGAEASLLLFIALSGGHYLMLWGSFFEKRLVENQRRVKVKKGENRIQAEEEEAARKEMVLSEYRPTIWKSLPVILVQFGCSLFLHGLSTAKERMTAVPPREETEEEDMIRRPRRPITNEPREERVVEVAEVKAVVADAPEQLMMREEEKEIKQEGVWSSEDMAELVKLATIKFPPGMGARWQHISKAMGRSVEDVTSAAKRIKHFQASEELSARQSIKVDQRSGEWSKDEQKLLEGALVKYPKGTEERWDRIAEELPGRTKDEVVERFKQLAQMIKARKDMKA
ncbi:hypothetical protein PRIPAC_94040, partial [Pristionchus pacificus]|uniref:DnaJ homolog subfamily C member 2 n=1 Tax=Pristionchus pacificus TaxID=54126 RepID=A0A2A6BAJ6_PRIPA